VATAPKSLRTTIQSLSNRAASLPIRSSALKRVAKELPRPLCPTIALTKVIGLDASRDLAINDPNKLKRQKISFFIKKYREPIHSQLPDIKTSEMAPKSCSIF
jgi:hypothetical protein